MVACQTFLVVEQNQTLVEVAFAMVEPQKEKLVVDPELKTLEVLSDSELLKMVVVLVNLALFVDNQADFQEFVLFGRKRDHPWLVEKVEVQKLVLVLHQMEGTEDHRLAYRLVQMLVGHCSEDHRLVVAQAYQLTKGRMQKDQDENSLLKKAKVQKS